MSYLGEGREDDNFKGLDLIRMDIERRTAVSL